MKGDITVRGLTDREKAKFKRLADGETRSVNNMMLVALRSYLEANPVPVGGRRK